MYGHGPDDEDEVPGGEGGEIAAVQLGQQARQHAVQLVVPHRPDHRGQPLRLVRGGVLNYLPQIAKLGAMFGLAFRIFDPLLNRLI